LAGYGIRLASGVLTDRTGRYWPITLTGYLINLISVPLLALAGRWETAAALIVAERAGRAVRSPARDAMLSHAASQSGVGWGFGLHEALDQLGAVAGPLLLSAVLLRWPGYSNGYGFLAIPALCALACLLVAWRRFPDPRSMEDPPNVEIPDRLPGRFWVYACGAALLGAGFIDFPLIAYHLTGSKQALPVTIPVLYAVAMAADGIAALFLGWALDKVGTVILLPVVLLSALSVPMVLLGTMPMVWLGIVLWGVSMAAQESVMRAVVARLVPVLRRGTAFGAFNAVFGLGWFVGSVAVGFAYDQAVWLAVAAGSALQLAAIPVFLTVLRKARQ
jgi:MFS family permease